MADLVIPALGESITEAVIARWLVKVGDFVKQDQPVLDLETDKITVQLPSPVAGTLKEQRQQEGATVRVGEVVGAVEAGAQPANQKSKGKDKDQKVESKPPTSTSGNGRNKTGADKPVAQTTKSDKPRARSQTELPTVSTVAPAPVPRETRSAEMRTPVLPPSKRRQALENPAPANAPVETRAPTAPPRAETRPETISGDEEIVKMSPLRKRIAERLVEVQQNSASLTTFNEVDMSRLMALRDTHKEDFQKTYGVKLGYMSFFVKAAVAALKLYPGLNAEVRGDSIVYKKHYDIGIAVGTDRGLVVPVLRNCDHLDFAQIESGILALADKAKTGKLALDDLVGGTFTITNGGIYGSMMSTPILNYPQTGILGMHNIVKRPVVVEDQVAVRPIMYVAVTYDHRVVDGKEAVQFLVAIKDRLEDPERLLFSL
jgi:2-oxoglutarate dehydrogenase E2 component (dihydrolipoamide succinyltransferase)